MQDSTEIPGGKITVVCTNLVARRSERCAKIKTKIPFVSTRA